MKLYDMYQFCQEGCEVCLNQTQCSKCIQSYFLDYSQNCVLTCPNTYSPDSTLRKCVCSGGQIETPQNKCQCQDGYSFLNNVCMKCPDNCQTCTSSTVCTLCNSTYLLNFNKQCVSQCPDTYEPDQALQKCICGANKTEINNSCVCNEGYLLEGATCSQCPQNCKVCLSTSQCTTCFSNYYLDYSKQCGSECPATYQKDITGICSCQGGSFENSLHKCVCQDAQVLENGVCVSCPPDCLECYSSTMCTKCSASKLLSFENKCIDVCQDTFLTDLVNQKCYCPQNQSVNINGKCDCSEGFYRNSTTNNCEACPLNCSSCSSNTSCSKCLQGYYFNYSQECVSKCPDTYHIDSAQQRCVCGEGQIENNNSCSCPDKQVYENNKCVDCNSNCAQCISSTQCSKCEISYVLVNNQTCESQCPNNTYEVKDQVCVCGENKEEKNQHCVCKKGFFDSNNDGNCQSCIASCDVCQNSSECQQCSAKTYLNFQNQCGSDCPPSFIKDEQNLKCVCPNNFRLQYNQCLCDTGYSEVGGVCIKCPQNCNSCSSEQTCTKCFAGQFLDYNSTCSTDCPQTYVKESNILECVCGVGQTENKIKHECVCSDGYFPNSSDGTCEQCIPNCSQCSNSAECQKCSDNNFLDLQNKCVSECPATFVKDLQNFTCVCSQNSTLKNGICECDQGYIMQSNNTCKVQCSDFCESCTFVGECDVCQQGYFLNFDLTCVLKCPPSFIQNEQTKQCECDSLAELINVSQFEKKCVCPTDRIYQDGNKCLSCIKDCKKCTSGSVCDKCVEGVYKYNDGTCGPCDTKKGYFIKSIDECGSCKRQCLECSDELTCNVDLVCNYDEKYDPIKKECIRCIYDLDNQKCVDQCSDKQFYQQDKMLCSQCFYLDKQCVQICPATKYYVGDQNTCIKCYDQCLKCKGQAENECTECENPLQLQKNGQCLRCPEKEFFNQQIKKCESCDQNCKICSGQTKYDCTKCEYNFKPSILYDGKCVNDIQLKNEIEYKHKVTYSECQGSEEECKNQYHMSEEMAIISFGVNVGSLILLGVSLFFCPVINSISWYYIQIQQLLGNNAYFKKANIYYMNIGYLKNHQIYNVFNLISFNSLQNDEDLLINLNMYNFSLKLSNLYQHFLQNFFYQFVSFSLLLCFILIFYLLKNKFLLAYKINDYINLNMLIRYFMIAVNYLTVASLFVFKYDVSIQKGNIAFILVLLLFYAALQIFSIFILSCRKTLPIVSTVRVYQSGIHQEKRTQQFFWQVFEFRKIACILIQILYINNKGNGFIVLSTFMIFTIYLLVTTPFIHKICQISAIFTEVMAMLLLILFELMTNREEYNINISTAQSIAITYIALSFILNIYYIVLGIIYLLKYLKELKQKRRPKLSTDLQESNRESQAQISNSLEMSNIKKSLVRVSWKNVEKS